MPAERSMSAGIGAAPLAVVVPDAGGHPVVVKREDGAGILRVEIATAKAYGALGMGMSSRDIAARSGSRSSSARWPR